MSMSVSRAKAVRPMVRMPVTRAGKSTSSWGAIWPRGRRRRGSTGASRRRWRRCRARRTAAGRWSPRRGKSSVSVDRVGVPDRDAEQGEDLRQQPDALGVAGVGERRRGVERQVGAVSLEVLDVDPDPADVVVVQRERQLVARELTGLGVGAVQQRRVRVRHVHLHRVAHARSGARRGSRSAPRPRPGARWRCRWCRAARRAAGDRPCPDSRCRAPRGSWRRTPSAAVAVNVESVWVQLHRGERRRRRADLDLDSGCPLASTAGTFVA